jgi:hypothetical protein
MDNNINSYYAEIDPASDGRLDLQLHDLISQRKFLDYTKGDHNLWSEFPKVFTGVLSQHCPASADTAVLGDVYTSKCWSVGPEKEGGEQCGNYKKEGDCYNREHVWPVSWWGGSKNSREYPYTDIHHIWPSDGWVNGQRGNHPFCDVGEQVTPVSSNGCKVCGIRFF